MERSFKRISEGLKLPQESRERIRSQLISCQKQPEDIPMKKSNVKSRVLLLAAAITVMMALTLTAVATVSQRFRNDIIVSGQDEIRGNLKNSTNKSSPEAYAIVGPIGTPPDPLEEMIEAVRFKTDDWPVGKMIGGGVMVDYATWDFVEVLSSDPALRSRRVWRKDGAEKMEYTAENPANLLDTLTGRVTFDLSWMDEHYDYVPDANMSFVVTDKRGNYVSELFEALYAKPDGSGYIEVDISNVAPADHFMQGYIIDGSYETAYYYTSADGYEFLIRLHNGRVWVDCDTSHASVGLYGAYLSTDEIESILDNLSLSISEQ